MKRILFSALIACFAFGCASTKEVGKKRPDSLSINMIPIETKDGASEFAEVSWTSIPNRNYVLYFTNYGICAGKWEKHVTVTGDGGQKKYNFLADSESKYFKLVVEK